jgi:hypothetical protein
MKRLILTFLTPIVFSCGEKPTDDSELGNVLENLTFTVDTVVVDSGEEFIDLRTGLGFSDLSSDHSTLYLLDGVSQMIEIDLDRLRLIKKNQFEKEGPNGIGAYPQGFQRLSDENFLISSFQGNAIFSPTAEKIRDVKFSAKNIDGLSQDQEQAAFFGLLATEERTHFLSLPGNLFDGMRNLLVADFSSVKGKLIDIPAMDIASEMRIVLKSTQSMMVAVERVELQDLHGRAVISSSATSDIYLYDYAADSLRLVSYSHTLVPSKKERKARTEVETVDEFQKEWAKHQEQIGFLKFFWDEQRQQYYRFGSISIPKPSPDAEQKSEVFLFAYDTDFRLIGETKFDELSTAPLYPFFKDGKLWSYVNVDDELGFAVFSFNF